MTNQIGKNLVIIAGKLKSEKIVEMPEWAKFVKTSTAKEKVPQQDDWWYLRAASILRKVSINGPIGAGRLSKVYGGRKNRGHKPEKFMRGSRKIIRIIFQQFEEKNFLKKAEKGKKGRIITEKGKKFF